MKFHTGNFTRPVAGGKAIGEAGRWARSCPARAAGSSQHQGLVVCEAKRQRL